MLKMIDVGFVIRFQSFLNERYDENIKNAFDYKKITNKVSKCNDVELFSSFLLNKLIGEKNSYDVSKYYSV